MKKECTNPEIGRMIALYEFDRLSPEDKEKFEAHLLECDVCFQDLYEFSPAVEVMQENIKEFRKAVEVKKTIRERIHEKVFSFFQEVWPFYGKLVKKKPGRKRGLIPVLVGAMIVVLMILIFKPRFLYPPISKDKSKPQRIVIHEPEEMESKATMEKMSEQINVQLSEDKEKIVIVWNKVAGAQFYHVYLIENGMERQLTPETGLRETSLSFPAKEIKFNTNYVLKISYKRKDGARIHLTKEFMLKK